VQRHDTTSRDKDWWHLHGSTKHKLPVRDSHPAALSTIQSLQHVPPKVSSLSGVPGEAVLKKAQTCAAQLQVEHTLVRMQLDLKDTKECLTRACARECFIVSICVAGTLLMLLLRL
jgi:hypothetical protein